MRGKKGPRTLSKKTIPQLQNTLWPIFARYIKLNWSHDGVHCECYTCRKVIEIGSRDCHAGHWIPRTYSPTKYDENNVRPQCGQCNEYHHGRPVEFEANLRLEVGSDVVDETKERARDSWKWDRGWLIKQIEHYREEVQNMEEMLGL